MVPPLPFVTWVLGEAFLVSDILGWIQFQLGFGFPVSIPACWERFPVFPFRICVWSSWFILVPLPGLGCLLGWTLLELGGGDL